MQSIYEEPEALEERALLLVEQAKEVAEVAPQVQAALLVHAADMLQQV